jgi:hypothetical protein
MITIVRGMGPKGGFKTGSIFTLNGRGTVIVVAGGRIFGAVHQRTNQLVGLNRFESSLQLPLLGRS